MSLQIEYIDDVEDVYDITVEDNHNFYANGILVHNCMEITLHTVPLKSTNDGYNNRVIEVLNSEKLQKLINQYGFVPRKYEGTVFRIIDSNDELQNSTNMMFCQVEDKNAAEIALCILAAIDVGKVSTTESTQRVTRLLVRFLDNLIDIQDYPLKAGEVSAKLRRTLGVGISNLAYFLAKNDALYSDGSGLKLVHSLFEKIQFNLIRASVELAAERGACEKFNDTNYSRGLLPIDTYAKSVDKLVPNDLKLDWEWLRGEIKKYGMRNSTLSALMPVESSSLVTNSCNGIEPIRGLKTKKRGLNIIAPEVESLFGSYELMWDMASNKGFIEIVAVMQKFVDQSISANTRYDPKRYESRKVPTKTILKDILYARKLGVKTLYYHYTNDDEEEERVSRLNSELSDSSNSNDDDENCESCVL